MPEDERLIELQSRISEQENQLEDLLQQVAEQKAQVDDMLNSTSWKLSFPIRWVKQRLLNFKEPQS